MTALLRITNLSKSYGGVRALCDVGFQIEPGEIHGLVGENGAGKSTLIKCLSGVVIPDEGSMSFREKQLPTGDVRASESAGVAVIHQESTAFPDLNTIDNIFVGREHTRLLGCVLNHSRMVQETNALMKRLGQTFDIFIPVRDLSVAQRQMVSMARALSQQCRLLIMDEPTASLSARETERLIGIVRQLQSAGVSIMYVSHRLEEIFQLADRVTVLRDGEYVGTQTTSGLDRSQLIKLMVGRDEASIVERTTKDVREREMDLTDVRLSVRQLCQPGSYQDISFDVHRGEIVGLAGLVGAGRSEVARAVFGVDSYLDGEVIINGRPLRSGSVELAVRAGLALVSEDRQHEGLVLPMTVRENLTLAVLRRLSRFGMIRSGQEQRLAQDLIDRLGVKTSSANVAARTLSGGNQQKVVIAKWLACQPDVLLLDEPTRGVDVGAKAQVHRLIQKLAADGMATLVISSELSELLAICDRILVMRDGSISGEMEAAKATQEDLLRLALPN